MFEWDEFNSNKIFEGFRDEASVHTGRKSKLSQSAECCASDVCPESLKESLDAVVASLHNISDEL